MSKIDITGNQPAIRRKHAVRKPAEPPKLSGEITRLQTLLDRAIARRDERRRYLVG